MDGSIDIQAEIRKLMTEESGLTLVTLHPRLRARFPHFVQEARRSGGDECAVAWVSERDLLAGAERLLQAVCTGDRFNAFC